MLNRRFLFSLVTLVLLAGPVSAIRVEGTVETSAGKALAGARLDLVPAGGPLERARLWLAGQDSEPSAATAESDDRGRFVLEASTRGFFTVRVRAAGFVGAELNNVAVAGDRQLPPATLKPDQGCRVEARGTDGDPLAGAWILSRQSGPATHGWTPAARRARTAADGTVHLPCARDERLDVALFVPERTHLEERQGVTDATFTVAPASDERQRIEVYDERGAPLAGVVVALGPLAWPVGRTGEDGSLEFPAPGESLTVHLIGADGRLLRAPLDERVARFTLAAPARLAVRVLREQDRRPVPGALVWPAFDPSAFAVSDAEGRGLLRVPADRRVGLRVLAEGFLPSAGVADGSSRTEILLTSGHPVHGRVADPEGDPVAGAEVSLRPTADPRSRPAHTLTGADGRFEVAHLGADRVDVLARRAGYAPTLVRGIPSKSAPSPTPETPPSTDLGTLILTPGAAITGRVRDATGHGIPGVDVWLSEDLRRPAVELLAHEAEEAPFATTDATGSFTVEDLEPGGRFHVVLRRDGYLPVALEAVKAPRRALEVVLEAGAAVRGRVEDEAGGPIPGAAVTLTPAAPAGLLELPPLGPESHRAAVTGEDGVFTFDTVPAGRFQADVHADGYVRPPGQALSVDAGGEVTGLTFVLDRGAVLAGQARTADGKPLAGVWVRVDGSGGRSGDDGTYRVAGVPLGRQRVEAHHGSLDRVVDEVEVAEGKNVHDFVFAAGHAAGGRVVDEAGAPVEGARVEWVKQDWDNPRHLETVTGEDGRFRFGEVADGRYTVRASKSGHAWTELPGPVEVAGGPAEEVEVVLPAGVVLAGRVLGLEPEELRSVEIVAERAGAPRRRGSLDYTGAYEITDLGAGDYLVRALASDRRREARLRVAVAPGVRRIERDLLFDGGFTLDGQVLVGGEPLAGARVSVTGYDVDLERRVLADHEGAFRLEDLPRGGYRLSASHPRKLLLSNENLTLEADERVVIEIEAAKVHGYVVSTRGEPLAGAGVFLHQVLPTGSGSLYQVSTDAEGYFALPQLTAGRYRATLRHDGYEQHEEVLDLVAGAAGAPYRFELKPTAGLRLDVAFADGSRPPYVTVGITGEDGRTAFLDRRNLGADGRVLFPTLGAGTWDVQVSAPGAVAQERTVEVPGEPLSVLLAPASRLRLRLPALVESDRVATVHLFDAAGQPFRTVGEDGVPVERWELRGGVADVAGVPPGEWTVEVVAGDGQTWRQGLVTAGAGEVRVSLQ